MTGDRSLYGGKELCRPAAESIEFCRLGISGQPELGPLGRSQECRRGAGEPPLAERIPAPADTTLPHVTCY